MFVVLFLLRFVSLALVIFVVSSGEICHLLAVILSPDSNLVWSIGETKCTRKQIVLSSYASTAAAAAAVCFSAPAKRMPSMTPDSSSLTYQRDIG